MFLLTSRHAHTWTSMVGERSVLVALPMVDCSRTQQAAHKESVTSTCLCGGALRLFHTVL